MTNNIRILPSDRIVLLIILSLVALVLVGCTGSRLIVSESYQREFGLEIPKPATGPWPLWFIFHNDCISQENRMYDEVLGVEYGTVKEGYGHWTTTAFYEAAFVNPLFQITYRLPFQLIPPFSLALFTLCPRVIGPTYT